jgi:hypothetical protein
MRPIKHISPFLFLLSITLAGCTSAVPTTNPPNPTPVSTATNVAPSPTSTEVAIPSESVPLVSKAVADLALRLQVTEEAIEVVSVEAVEWPNTGLGCPQPGMMYAQVITPGYLLILVAMGESHWYHTDAVEQVILCGEDGTWLRPPIPIQPGEEIQDGEPWMPVN